MIQEFKNIITDIMEKWEIISPRGLPCSEIISYSFKIEDAHVLAADFEWRDFPWRYLAAEMIWYLSWDLTIYQIQHYAKLWWKISDQDNQINSNYWHIVLHKKLWTWKTQYDTVLDSLREDQNTRQALMRYNSHDHAYEWNKDFPCTISNQFFIRWWKLHILVNMRSNDMFMWFQFDVLWFGLLLQSLAKDLFVEPWNIYWNAWSAHIYQNMFEKAKTIISNEKWEEYRFYLNESFISLRDRIVQDPMYFWTELKKHFWNERYFIEHYLNIEITKV